ncbi:periplasmic glucan biosynthesis protein MdoG [Pseudodesulfovibrio mercurii]|uniref:Periplasmic glucan biosynthesis protein MdoG n=1 Tax=Pseudodesulfovibrio mercurii TaxID=641491 RepID=F0JGA7_9BACT|nr:glucan biosynthesis protein [Pseudodesulfovibrio mercurii]EGB13855.1 periplasmic glucan biosynthesis protein MdoG [Pseudodesulfovibrio mercurii]
MSQRIHSSGRALGRLHLLFPALLLLAQVLPGTLPVKPALAGEETPFSRQVVVDKARQLSQAPFAPAQGEVPQALLDLDYDAWRDIRFRPDKALWKDEKLSFQVQFFHPGLFYDRLVDVHVVTKDATERIPFDPALFDYGNNHSLPEQIPERFGFAGFRIHGPINTPSYFDEVAVFLGASYFRAVAKGQAYGISARGLAVDTALPDGEEFPYFKEFWIEKPTRKSTSLTVHALLDSKSLTGAYTFVIESGRTTTMDVTATLFLRIPVAKIGIAPLTSMFLFGENTDERKVRDFRPEVHDSDGLLIKNDSGEWFWRPLDNPENLEINAFSADNVRGFGLVQRDRDFAHYEDLEAGYERRPTLWVEPVGDWGFGHVELINIPTDKEIHDNIVAFWSPRDPLPVGVPQTYAYRLLWYNGGFTHPPLGYVSATRTGDAWGGGQRFIVDFQSKALALLQPPSKVEGVVTCGKGAVVAAQNVEKNPHTGGWRLSFVIRPDQAPSALEKVLPNRRPPVDLRAFLKINDTTLTETWNYAYRP